MLVQQSLDAVGLSELEERIYLALVNEADISLAELAQGVGVPDRQVRASLRGLEQRGLVSRKAERSARYAVAPPGPALEALVLRQHAALERVRSLADELAHTF